MSGRPTAEDLDAWVRATAPRAVAYARSLLRDQHTAEDVVQDCYCRLLAKAAVYDLPTDGVKLLMTAISNACINVTTRRRSFFRLVRSGEDGDASEDPPDPTAPPPEQLAMHAELATAVAAGLKTLPEQQRAAIELKALGHSQQEIAEILSVTPSNAGVLIHRGRQTLEKYLAPYLDREDAP